MTQDPGLAGWLQLTLTPGLTPAGLRSMLRQFGLPQAVLDKKRSELAPFASAQALAVVGSRNASAQGEHNAHSFAKALSDAGLCIVSGLALGIDAAAHRGALAGASSTLAVLGTGIDIA